MHQYLRSIGFSQAQREQDIDRLLKSCEKHCMETARRYVDGREQMWLELRGRVSDRAGICIIGYIGARGRFHRTAYYPYLQSGDITSTVKPSVYRRVDGGLFSAIIDDGRVGMTIIFQLDNPLDYLHKCGEGNPITDNAACRLSGMCTKGYVLLPSVKAEGTVGVDAGEQADPAAAAPTDHNNEQDAHMTLLEAARSGQTEAIEQLAMEEMQTISMLSRRLQNEDIYSIVSSVFMPQGVECDIYLVVGDIIRIERIVNAVSGEIILDLTLNVNDMIIHVAINEADLEGEPEVGRRFKGRIWLQGCVDL